MTKFYWLQHKNVSKCKRKVTEVFLNWIYLYIRLYMLLTCQQYTYIPIFGRFKFKSSKQSVCFGWDSVLSSFLTVYLVRSSLKKDFDTYTIEYKRRTSIHSLQIGVTNNISPQTVFSPSTINFAETIKSNPYHRNCRFVNWYCLLLINSKNGSLL